VGCAGGLSGGLQRMMHVLFALVATCTSYTSFVLCTRSLCMPA